MANDLKKNSYEVLDIPNTATWEEIQKKYRNLSRNIHPDKNKAVDADQQFQELVAAYENLKPENREAYDKKLEGKINLQDIVQQEFQRLKSDIDQQILLMNNPYSKIHAEARKKLEGLSAQLSSSVNAAVSLDSNYSNIFLIRMMFNDLNKNITNQLIQAGQLKQTPEQISRKFEDLKDEIAKNYNLIDNVSALAHNKSNKAKINKLKTELATLFQNAPSANPALSVEQNQAHFEAFNQKYNVLLNKSNQLMRQILQTENPTKFAEFTDAEKSTQQNKEKPSKAAGSSKSSIRFDHLKSSFKRSPVDGLRALLLFAVEAHAEYNKYVEKSFEKHQVKTPEVTKKLQEKVLTSLMNIYKILETESRHERNKNEARSEIVPKRPG